MSGRDGWLAGAAALLAVFGLAVQMRLQGHVPGAAFFAPFVLGAAGAIAAAAALTPARAERWLRGRWFAVAAAAALMALLLVFGRRYRGGLYLPGRLNPSELVKLCAVFFLAGTLGHGRGAGRWLAGVGALGIVAAEIVCAGDFGLLAQLALTGAAMLFAASWGWGAAAWGAVAAGVAFVLAHPAGHLAARVQVWRDPFADVTGTGWQTLQAAAAVAHGGVTGSGFGLGDVENVPIVSSDFVYAALAEELGLAGCAAVLALYAFIFARGLGAARRAAARGETGAALLAAGIVASLAVQTLLNVAGVLNVVPMTGITLPLVSHGGSSQAVTLVMLGALAGLSRRAE